MLKSTGPGNGDGFSRNILVTTAVTRADRRDSIDYIHAIGYLPEDRVTPALHGFAAMIQKPIVGMVDKELGS